MNTVVFLIGLLLPSGIGWALVRLCEGHYPFLHPIERTLYGVLIGPIAVMEVAFFTTWAGITGFTLVGFLSVHAVLLIMLGYILWKRRMLGWNVGTPSLVTGTLPHGRLAHFGVIALVLWVAVRFLFGAFNLTQLPTYWDDTIDNWNMRGKAFYVAKDIILEIPNTNGTVTSKEGESSYPPSIPLFKTWLTTLRGEWDDGLVNTINAVWYVVLVGLFYFILRRRLSLTWSILGTYLLASEPLVLIQGVNPYTDILVAACITGVIGALLSASGETGPTQRGWLLLGALTLGMATFTKNEILILHLPALLIVMLALSRPMGLKMSVKLIAIVAAFVLPWLAFKWANGLTFGNAKAASSVTIGWHPDALLAMWNMIAKEANFLFLPLMLVVTLLLGAKRAMTREVKIVLGVFLFALGVQIVLYAFTSLSIEAIRQTGLGRGLLQLTPLATLIVVLLGAKLLSADDE